MTPQASEEYKVDRTGWDPGPWDSEPDLVDFEYAGFPCQLRRNHMGGWCGYVGLPPTHSAYGKSYDDVPVEVHGGLTYGDKRDGGLWWFGFDCGHFMDLLPYMHANSKMREMGLGSLAREHEVYRTIDYVQKETENLAEQLGKI